MKSDARTIAYTILCSVDRQRATLDSVMEKTLGRVDLQKKLDKRERALVTTLVYGVLRWRYRLDWTIQQISKTPLEKIDGEVLTILRLGAFQLIYLDRVPDFAAVNGAVTLAKKAVSHRVAGFINGILRNLIRRRDELRLPQMDDDPVIALAVTYSFPQWLIERWLNRYGLEATRQLCDQINAIPPITVRVNTRKVDVETVRRSLTGEAGRVEDGVVSEEGLRMYSLQGAVHELTAFRKGWIQVQDEAAQLVCRLLTPQAGDRVLDACAGLGGKTGCIAQLMNDTGRIVAVDNDSFKLDRLIVEMKRLGLNCVETATVDLFQATQLEELGVFDRVFADCPCSGLGVLRRNPDTKWSRDAESLARYHNNQVTLLHHLADRVRPGGVLVYAVCSREPEENDDVVRSFLNKHPEFDIDNLSETSGNLPDITDDLPDYFSKFIDSQGYFKTLPYPHQMDGFFGARLKKRK